MAVGDVILRGVKGQEISAAEYDDTINTLHKNPDGINIPSTGQVGV